MATTSCRASGCPLSWSLWDRGSAPLPRCSSSTPLLLAFPSLHPWSHSPQPGRPRHHGADRYADAQEGASRSWPCYPLLLWPEGKKGRGPPVLTGGGNYKTMDEHMEQNQLI